MRACRWRPSRAAHRSAPTEEAPTEEARADAVAFSPDGRTQATGGDDNTAVLGRSDRPASADPARVEARLCSVVDEPISATGWEAHFPGLPHRPPCR